MILPWVKSHASMLPTDALFHLDIFKEPNIFPAYHEELLHLETRRDLCDHPLIYPFGLFTYGYEGELDEQLHVS